MAYDESSYHIVYRAGDQTRILGRITGVPGTWYTLDPFLSRLLLAGIHHGELLLVEDATRRIVVRRAVRLPRRHMGSGSSDLTDGGI